MMSLSNDCISERVAERLCEWNTRVCYCDNESSSRAARVIESVRCEIRRLSMSMQPSSVVECFAGISDVRTTTWKVRNDQTGESLYATFLLTDVASFDDETFDSAFVICNAKDEPIAGGSMVSGHPLVWFGDSAWTHSHGESDGESFAVRGGTEKTLTPGDVLAIAQAIVDGARRKQSRYVSDTEDDESSESSESSESNKSEEIE